MRLNEQVKRNSERFPADFAFQLTDEYLSADNKPLFGKEGEGEILWKHFLLIASKGNLLMIGIGLRGI